MFGLMKLDAHANLMKEMGAAVGADLGDAVAAGRLSAPDLRNALLRCTGCADVGACEDWLNDHPRGSDHAPGFCRNRELFDRLQAATQA
jgi:hypothetical protein